MVRRSNKGGVSAMKAKILPSLMFLMGLMTTQAFADVPQQLSCHRELTNGWVLVHNFSFRRLDDTQPARYNVSIWIGKAPPFQGDPSGSVGNDDPPRPSPWHVVLDTSYRGTLSTRDGNVIYFAGGHQGFVNLSGKQVILQIPGERLPELLDNCVIPETGFTVHN